MFEKRIPAFKHKKLSDYFKKSGDMYFFCTHSADYEMNGKELPDRVQPENYLFDWISKNMIYGCDFKQYYFELILTNCGSYDLYVKYNVILGSRMIGENLEGI